MRFLVFFFFLNIIFFKIGCANQNSFVYSNDSQQKNIDVMRDRIRNQYGELSQNYTSFSSLYAESRLRMLIYSTWSIEDFACATECAVREAIMQGGSRFDVEQELLEQYELYAFPAFCEHIKTFCGYRSHIKKMRNNLLNKKQKWHRFLKALGFLDPMYVQQLDVAEKLYAEILAEEAIEQRCNQDEVQRQNICIKQAIIKKQENIRTTFDNQREIIMQLSDEWYQLQDIGKEYGFYKHDHYAQRIEALHAFNRDGCIYEHKRYQLPSHIAQFARNQHIDITEYQTCYGNQLQHIIHQECLQGLDSLAALSETSLIYDYRECLGRCIDAAREYNQIGIVDKAAMILDFCWSLFDYGKAIAEGTVEGLVGAVRDIYDHPAQAMLCAIAGEYVFAYQLSKVLLNVADIGVSCMIDFEQGKKEWDDYIAPLTQFIDAIANKEISIRDGLKSAMQCAVQWKAQSVFLKGMHALYKNTKIKACDFAKNNPLMSPEQYMETPEGVVFKVLHYDVRDTEKLKNINPNQLKNKLEWTSHGFKHFPPRNLSWKDIVKATRNGRAFYKPEINIQELELYAWQNGIPVTNGKNWKVFKAAKVIGANQGKETVCMRVEFSANTIHGHPILESEYLEYLK